jgi:molecular chaperone GrpE
MSDKDKNLEKEEHKMVNENDQAQNVDEQVEDTAVDNSPETTSEEATEEVTPNSEESEGKEESKKKSKRGSRGGAKSKNAKLEEEMEQLKTDNAELKDKYIRMVAEFDNYRKRTAKERQEYAKIASKNVVMAIIPALDDFYRAVKVADDTDNTEQVPDGMKLLFDKLSNSLEVQGLKKMDSEAGTNFDPELHSAIAKIPAPSDEMKGKIVDTAESGYYLNDKIIRHAKVIVGQ